MATVWAKLDATQRALDAATAELERLRCSKRPGRRLGSGGGDRVRAELAVARVEGTAMACQLAAVRAEAERLKAAVCTAALAEADASSPALGAEAAAARRDTQAALAERDCALAALAALRAELARARQAAPAVARPRHWQAGARKEAAERPARPFLSLAESVT